MENTFVARSIPIPNFNGAKTRNSFFFFVCSTLTKQLREESRDFVVCRCNVLRLSTNCVLYVLAILTIRQSMWAESVHRSYFLMCLLCTVRSYFVIVDIVFAKKPNQLYDRYLPLFLSLSLGLHVSLSVGRRCWSLANCVSSRCQCELKADQQRLSFICWIQYFSIRHVVPTAIAIVWLFATISTICVTVWGKARQSTIRWNICSRFFLFCFRSFRPEKIVEWTNRRGIVEMLTYCMALAHCEKQQQQHRSECSVTFHSRTL